MKAIKILVSCIIIVVIEMSFNYFGRGAAWKAPKSADAIKNPLKGNATATAAGKKLFIQMCAICHGNKGKGDGVASASLNPKPANFTSAKVQAQTDGALFWKLTNGNPPMASYKASLKENQRWQLVNYIRTLVKKKKVKSKAINKPKEQPQAKVETPEEKTARLEKESNKKFSDLVVVADKFYKEKKYKAAKSKYEESLKIKPNNEGISIKLKELEPLIAAANKRSILKQEIKQELKEELKQELKEELKQELKEEILKELRNNQ